MAPSIVIWTIWLERNSRIFRHKSTSLEQVLDKILSSIFELVFSHIYKNMEHLRSFSHWDNWVTWKWSSLCVIPSHGALTAGLSSLVKCRMAKWMPPPQFSFKLNFDGAFKDNLRKSRTGWSSLVIILRLLKLWGNILV